MRDLNTARGLKLARAYAEAPHEADREMRELERDPLFISGVMLYADRGDTDPKRPIALSFSEPVLAQIFARFLERVCAMPPERVRAHLLLYPGLDEWLCRIHWAKEAGLPARNFTKASAIKGRAAQAPFGICVITVSNAYLKLKLLEWARKLPRELLDKR